jgi:hypothetical protein
VTEMSMFGLPVDVVLAKKHYSMEAEEEWWLEQMVMWQAEEQ